MSDIRIGDTVTWHEGRMWRGVVLNKGLIHCRVQPTDPPGTANWIATAKLTRVETEREAVRSE